MSSFLPVGIFHYYERGVFYLCRIDVLNYFENDASHPSPILISELILLLIPTLLLHFTSIQLDPDLLANGIVQNKQTGIEWDLIQIDIDVILSYTITYLGKNGKMLWNNIWLPRIFEGNI